MSDDMTFCSNRDCERVSCEMNQIYIQHKWMNHSVADYHLDKRICPKLKNNDSKKKGRKT